MGTSADFSAPPNWNRGLKGTITRIGGRVPTPKTARRLLSKYISSNGGSSSMSSGGGRIGSGSTARSVARSLGGFFTSVANDGIDSALRQAGVGHLVGQSVTNIMLGLVAHFGGPATDHDSVDARNALSTTMDDLCKGVDSPVDLERLLTENVSETGIASLLMTFFANYLYEQFCRVFFGQLISRHGDEMARSFLGSIRDVIHADVARQASGLNVTVIDWAGAEGQAMSETIMHNTLAIFG